MSTARVAGHDFDFTPAEVERCAAGIDPEPIREHYVVVGPRRFPPKQLLGALTGLDRADFTTHQARAILRRLGFGVYRRSTPPATLNDEVRLGPRAGAEGQALGRFAGRWVAQDGDEILFDAASPEAVVQWLRRHNRRARVWRVPVRLDEVGSALSTP